MTADPKAARLQKVFPVDLDKFLPDIIKRNYGKWVDRRFHGYGIIEHISETGRGCSQSRWRCPPTRG